MIASSPGDSAGDVGFVTPSFGEGALILRGEGERLYRLSWEVRAGESAPTDRRRALAPGSYKVVGYRIVRRAAGDAPWHVSASAHSIRKLRIERGEETQVAIDETVRVAQRFDGKELGMAIRGENGCGISIYRGGARIAVRYRLLDERGDELATGDMRYG